MKKANLYGKIILIISILVVIFSIGTIIYNATHKDEVKEETYIYEVDNSFRVDSPLGFNGPYKVNVYGIVENKSNKKIENVIIKVYYYDVERKRHEVEIPVFDIDANSEYTIDYDTTGDVRAFYIDKIEYKIGNNGFKEMSRHGTFSDVSSNAWKFVPFIILLFAGMFGIVFSIPLMAYKEIKFDKISTVFTSFANRNIVKCEYCGSSCKRGILKCPNCGAALEYKNDIKTNR